MEQKIKFPRSQKVYLPGKLYPNIRVAMRKVEQVPSVSFEGEEKIVTPNPEVYMYDTSGPFSDTEMSIDLKKGLPRMREEWIVGRGDVEQLPEITSEYGQMRRNDKSLDHLRFEHIALPYRAKKGEAITQMAYAKKGIITPEMEYVAIRENMNCEELGIKTYITPEFVLVGGLFSAPVSHSDLIYTGFVSENEKYAIIRHAKIMVNPSKFDSLSLILLEGMQLGKPMLVNGKCEVLKEHCSKSEKAALAYWNKNDFISKLASLETSSELCREMGKKGKVYVETYYSWSVIMERLKKAIESV